MSTRRRIFLQQSAFLAAALGARGAFAGGMRPPQDAQAVPAGADFSRLRWAARPVDWDTAMEQLRLQHLGMIGAGTRELADVANPPRAAPAPNNPANHEAFQFTVVQAGDSTTWTSAAQDHNPRLSTSDSPSVSLTPLFLRLSADDINAVRDARNFSVKLDVGNSLPAANAVAGPQPAAPGGPIATQIQDFVYTALGALLTTGGNAGIASCIPMANFNPGAALPTAMPVKNGYASLMLELFTSGSSSTWTKILALFTSPAAEATLAPILGLPALAVGAWLNFNHFFNSLNPASRSIFFPAPAIDGNSYPVPVVVTQRAFLDNTPGNSFMFYETGTAAMDYIIVPSLQAAAFAAAFQTKDGFYDRGCIIRASQKGHVYNPVSEAELWHPELTYLSLRVRVA